MSKSSLKTRAKASSALRGGPAVAPAHLALAQGLEKIGRSGEAIASYEAAIRSDPGSLAAYLGLARVLLSAGRATEAFGRADHALSLDGENVEAWTMIATTLAALGEPELAARAYERTLALAPAAADLHVRIAGVYETLDRPFDAAARYQRALMLDGGASVEVDAHVGLSGLYGRSGQFAEARAHAEAALKLAPGARGAHQNLAAVCDHEGREAEAEAHRESAYRAAPLIVTRAPSPRRRVLTLASAARANSPDRYLIPSARYDRLVWFIAYADGRLTPGADYDVVFNAIGDPDAGLRDQVERFVARCERPVLNPPERIARTARDRARALFEGVADLVAPETRRVAQAADLQGLAENSAWLMRPLGAHGGERLERLESDAVASRLNGRGQYLTAFHDFRSADGLYRKYRVFFVNGEPFPYHLAIHDHWLVHYQSCLTPTQRAFIEEERRFLESPEQALGPRAYRAIGEVGRRMGLDFAGVDFAVLPDGAALLFEANATMFIHPEPSDSPLAYKNPFVARILEAFWARLESA